jgi:hypothetical protein
MAAGGGRKARSAVGLMGAEGGRGTTRVVKVERDAGCHPSAAHEPAGA